MKKKNKGRESSSKENIIAEEGWRGKRKYIIGRKGIKIYWGSPNKQEEETLEALRR